MHDLIIGSALPWILGGVAFFGSIAVAFFKGKGAEKAKQTYRRLEGMKHKQEVQKDVQSHTDDELIDGITRRK